MNPKGEGMDSLQWDGGVRRRVTLEESVNFDDAFAIIKVSDADIYNLNTLSGIVPILGSFIDRFTTQPEKRMTPEEFIV